MKLSIYRGDTVRQKKVLTFAGTRDAYQNRPIWRMILMLFNGDNWNTSIYAFKCGVLSLPIL